MHFSNDKTIQMKCIGDNITVIYSTSERNEEIEKLKKSFSDFNLMNAMQVFTFGWHLNLNVTL